MHKGEEGEREEGGREGGEGGNLLATFRNLHIVASHAKIRDSPSQSGASVKLPLATSFFWTQPWKGSRREAVQRYLEQKLHFKSKQHFAQPLRIQLVAESGGTNVNFDACKRISADHHLGGALTGSPWYQLTALNHVA